MIRSALSDGLPEVIEAEVCVVGAGPAGIVAALELARRGLKVVLVEGGSIDGPGDGEDAYAGESSGRPYPVQGSRLRWLGGTSNHWGGWVRPLDPVDFKDKPQLDLPAWPIDYSDLERWYAKADEWCEIAPGGYRWADSGLADSGHVFDLPDRSDFQHEFFRFSPPTRFGARYRAEIAELENLVCWVDLTVTELIQNENTVRAMVGRTTSGEQTQLRAKQFVLAQGGLEIPRLLLAQNDVPGNHAGWVGKCFMDHFGFTPGHLLAGSELRYRVFEWQGTQVMPILRPTDDLVLQGDVANTCIMLATAAPTQSLPPAYWLNPVISGREVEDALTYRITFINEPLPDPTSRISLSSQKDRFDMPRLTLHWHLPTGEFDRALNMLDRLRRFVGASGLGRVQWLRRSGTPEDQTPGVGYHHMGTTRMSAHPDYGVTDSNCRVWDRDNLYIASSSVFPTAGYANPTLTICALSARLADHLSKKAGA